MPPSSHALEDPPPSEAGYNVEVGVSTPSSEANSAPSGLKFADPRKLSIFKRLLNFVKMLSHGLVNSKQFKYFLLFTLTVNTSMTVLILRLSKFSLGSDGHHYESSTAILVAEVFKFLICYTALVFSEGTNWCDHSENNLSFIHKYFYF